LNRGPAAYKADALPLSYAGKKRKEILSKKDTSVKDFVVYSPMLMKRIDDRSLKSSERGKSGLDKTG
jgi:hypothetical protein